MSARAEDTPEENMRSTSICVRGAIARGTAALAVVGLGAGLACRSAVSPGGPDATAPMAIPVASPASDAALSIVPDADAPAEDAGEELADACPRKDDADAPTLRNVDWANCGYPGAWGGRLRDGHAESHIYGPGGGAHDTIATELVAVAYGDVDGDAHEEAVVALKETTWMRTGRDASSSGTLHLFALRRGRVALVATGYSTMPTGVRILGRRIVVDTQWSFQGAVHERCKSEVVLRGPKLEEGPRRCSDAGVPWTSEANSVDGG